MTLRIQPSRRYVKLGEGVHSEVFRRLGSKYVVQLFKVECPELTVLKIQQEYGYLRRTYEPLAQLIPRQRLFSPSPLAHISQTVLVKEFVQVDPKRNLRVAPREHIGERALQQIAIFTRITGESLERTQGAVFVPDIIDPTFSNLVIDTAGDLRLLDTNRLISTRALQKARQAAEKFDLRRRKIHALMFRRLMYLESKYLLRSMASLQNDAAYARYLHSEDFTALFEQSAEIGEPWL